MPAYHVICSTPARDLEGLAVAPDPAAALAHFFAAARGRPADLADIAAAVRESEPIEILLIPIPPEVIPAPDAIQVNSIRDPHEGHCPGCGRWSMLHDYRRRMLCEPCLPPDIAAALDADSRQGLAPQ
jgi:hypothetical protein